MEAESQTALPLCPLQRAKATRKTTRQGESHQIPTKDKGRLAFEENYGRGLSKGDTEIFFKGSPDQKDVEAQIAFRAHRVPRKAN